MSNSWILFHIDDRFCERSLTNVVNILPSPIVPSKEPITSTVSDIPSKTEGPSQLHKSVRKKEDGLNA